MSIEINGKVYRNLPEQVEKNKDDIEKLKNYYPFSGPYATTDDIPEDLLVDKGKYLIGANEPYSIYQYDEENESFTDLGTFADPADYINKTGNVTGITGKKVFNLKDNHELPWYNESLTIDYDHDKCLRIYGPVSEDYAADYNEVSMNAHHIGVHGMGMGTQDFGHTRINGGYISLVEYPYEDGANVIQLGSKYGFIGSYTHYDNESGSGVGNPSGVLNQYELTFTPRLNSTAYADYQTTRYYHGAIGFVDHTYANPSFSIFVTNSSFNNCSYKFPYFTGEGLGRIRTVATIEDIKTKVPDAPTEDGTYTLKVTVSNGTPTYSWVLDN